MRTSRRPAAGTKENTWRQPAPPHRPEAEKDKNMAYIHGAVYSPPGPGLPLVAIVFGPDGEVLVARVTPTVEQGERLIAEVMSGSSGQRQVK